MFKLALLNFAFIISATNLSWGQSFDFEYRHKPEKPRNEILAPVVSFLFPGADQWYEGQYAAGALYTGYATFGLAASVYQTTRINELELDLEFVRAGSGNMPTNSREQREFLGAQAYMFAGFMSAYHSFRSSVKTRHQLSEYMFLQDNEDTLQNVALAPFNMTFMSRWTTLVPLGLIAGLVGAGVATENNRSQLSANDWAFTSGVSYHAGVGEEAFFHGFVYPMFQEKFDNTLLASGTSSLLFAAGHISPSNQVPVIQFAFGLYMDYLTRRNKWSIQEATFVHFWWDILAISAAFIVNEDEASNRTHHINLLSTSF
jgi:membrane protease YdiL (CAAX protease family)